MFGPVSFHEIHHNGNILETRVDSPVLNYLTAMRLATPLVRAGHDLTIVVWSDHRITLYALCSPALKGNFRSHQSYAIVAIVYCCYTPSKEIGTYQ